MDQLIELKKKEFAKATAGLEKALRLQDLEEDVI